MTRSCCICCMAESCQLWLFAACGLLGLPGVQKWTGQTGNQRDRPGKIGNWEVGKGKKERKRKEGEGKRRGEKGRRGYPEVYVPPPMGCMSPVELGNPELLETHLWAVLHTNLLRRISYPPKLPEAQNWNYSDNLGKKFPCWEAALIKRNSKLSRDLVWQLLMENKSL